MCVCVGGGGGVGTGLGVRWLRGDVEYEEGNSSTRSNLIVGSIVCVWVGRWGRVLHLL